MNSLVRVSLFLVGLAAGATVSGQTPAPVPVYQWSTLSGRSTVGSEEGGRYDARFNHPDGMVMDAVGNIFIADTANHSIRRLGIDGVVRPFAGTSGEAGYKDDTGAAARFRSPTKLAIDVAGNLYVADSGNFVIRKITPEGIVTTLAGRPGQSGSTNGAAATAQFTDIQSMVAAPGGALYVFDHHVRKILSGTVSDAYSGGTFTDATTGQAFTITLTGGIAVNPAGELLCAAKAQPWPTPGLCVVRVDGANNVAFLIRPEVLGQSTSNSSYAVALGPILTDNAGGLYLSQSVRLYYGEETWVVHWTPTGGVTEGAGMRDGSGRPTAPRALVRDSLGRLLATRESDSALVQLLPQAMVFAGTPRTGTPVDGTISDARFSSLRGVGTDTTGNVWVTDGRERYFVENSIAGGASLRKVSANGVVNTVVVGTETAEPQTYAGPLALDSADHVYYSRQYYNATITRVTPGGTTSSLPDLTEFRDLSYQLAPGGGAGSLALLGARGMLMKWEAATNQYRFIAGASGTDITRGSRLDGTGATARFATTLGITTDSGGNFYVLDTTSLSPGITGDTVIRKVTPEGVVSTISGNLNQPGATAGDVNLPLGLVIDARGRFFLIYEDDTVRLLATNSGQPVTIGGESWQTGNREGRGAAARFDALRDLAIDAQGNVYVTDQEGTVIRKGQYVGLAPAITTQPVGQTAALGATVRLSVVASGDPAPTYQWLHDGVVVAGATTDTLTISGLRQADTGAYAVKVSNAAGEVTSSSATVALTSAPNPPSGGGGGGGGGAPSLGFLVVLAVLAAIRRLRM